MEFSHKNILVIGGAGFIGSHLAEHLATNNFVRIMDDFSTGTRDNLAGLQQKTNVEILEGDITEPTDLAGACRSMDVVFHLAVSCLRTSLNDPLRSHEVNAGGTLQVCKAACDAQVGRLVYVSSSEVYGSARTDLMSESHPLEPLTVYGAAKLAGEFYVKAFQRTYGLPSIIVRPFNTYGPREPWQGHRAEVIPRFILRLLSGKPPVIFGDGSQTRDFTYVDDTVEGILAAARCDRLVGDVVNIAVGREVRVDTVATLLAKEFGVQVKPDRTGPRPGDVQRHAADVGKAAELLGFRAAVDLAEGLRRTLTWFRTNIAPEPVAMACSGKPNW